MSNEEDREAIAGEISGVQVGVGYESTTIGITAALEAADLLIAAGFHRTPTPAPAPAPDVQALIDFVHDAGLTSVYGRLDAREVSELNAILQSVEVSSGACSSGTGGRSVSEAWTTERVRENPYRKERADG